MASDSLRGIVRIAAVFTLLVPGGAVLAQYPAVKFKGRLQTEFRTSDAESRNADGTAAALNTVPSNEFFNRRAYLEFDARLTPRVRAKLEVNAVRRQVNLEDAFIEVAVNRFATWRVGQEKKPIERQELNSSNTYLTVERGALIAGLRFAELISENNFLTAAGFTAHDIGTSVELHTADTTQIPVKLRVGVWDGNGKDLAETNNAKTFGARLLVDPIRRLSIGASFVSHDDPRVVVNGSTRIVAADSAERSHAFGLDAEWGTFDGGLHIMADASTGRLSRLSSLVPSIVAVVAEPVAFEPRFRTTHIVGEYKWVLPEGSYLQAVAPVFRVDRTVPDLDHSDALGSTLLTPGLNVYISSNTWLMFNYDIVRPGDALDAGRGAGQDVHSFKSMIRIFF